MCATEEVLLESDGSKIRAKFNESSCLRAVPSRCTDDSAGRSNKKERPLIPAKEIEETRLFPYFTYLNTASEGRFLNTSELVVKAFVHN